VYIAQPPLYKIKKGKQEVYVKDDAELTAYLLNAALDGAELHVNAGAPALSAASLEALATEFTMVEGIIARLANRYDETVLRVITRLPALASTMTDDLDKLQAWTEQLSAALPKALEGRNSGGNGGTYTAVLERGDADGEGVRIAIRRMQHGISATRFIPREFFDTNEYAHIVSLSAKLHGLIGEGAYVARGDKRMAVESFAQALDWLLAEARKGQSLQRYKGLGEMNPEQLWETTVNPETRRLMQVKIEDAVKADEIFTTLMGDQVEPRREFIERNALTVSNLDV
jgi:DNA gyrase subunit B